MSETAEKLSLSSQSETLELELRTSGSPKELSPSIRSHDAAISGLNIEKKIAEQLASEKAKKDSPRQLSPRKTVKSLTTVAKKEVSQKESKLEIRHPKSLLKRAASNPVIKSPRIRTSSPKTFVKRETPIKLTKSPKRGKSLPKRPVEKGEPPKDKLPKKETNSLKVGKNQRRQSLISSISNVKSVKSVISKDSSRQVSQRSTIRDDIFRNYPFDSSLRRTSLTPDVSVMTSTSRGSTILAALNKSEKKSTTLKKGFWGPHKIRVLKPQPKEPEFPKEIRVSVKAKPEESSETSDAESFDLILLSDAEAEAKAQAESPVSEREDEVEEPPEDQRNNFLQIFGVLPDINDLSASESLNIMELSAPKAEVKFVPPVDMGSYESEGSESWSSPEEEMGIARSVECSSDITLDDLSESDEEPHKDPIVKEEPSVEDITVCLMSVRPRGTGEHMGFETSSTSSGHEVRLAIIEAIQAFLVGIINQTVAYAENPSLRLKRLLDPAKMIEELTQLSLNYKDELQRNLTLDQIICEYFLRRKELGFLCKAKDIDTIHVSRLRTAIMELDCHLEREKETQRASDNLVAELTEQERIARSLEIEEVKKFETKVRETLFKEGYDHLKYVTNDLLRKMNKVRDELSNSRREMTAVQHQLAFIKNKSEEMEDLGNGLRVHEYLSIQANTQSLSVKINERSIELQRLNDRMTYDIHAMAHLKNKEKMNQDLLRKMKEKLKTKEQRKKDLRDLLYAGMLRHNYLKKKMKSLRHSGSLMHYPDTLRDYDATVEHLEAKRQVILQLKAEHKRLERKISLVESGIASINLANKATASFHASTFRLSSKIYSKVRI